MTRELQVVLVVARACLGLVAAILFFVAGHQMRAQGSGIPWPYGLVAYGLAFVALMLAIPVTLFAATTSTRDSLPAATDHPGSRGSPA